MNDRKKKKSSKKLKFVNFLEKKFVFIQQTNKKTKLPKINCIKNVAFTASIWSNNQIERLRNFGINEINFQILDALKPFDFNMRKTHLCLLIQKTKMKKKLKKRIEF